MTTKSRVFHGLRQLFFYEEFRIATPASTSDVERQLAKVLEAITRLQEAPATEMNFLSDVGTGLWRLRRTLVPPGYMRLEDARPLEGMNKPFRWLISTWEALEENGLEIQDHTGDAYNAGQMLEAHFEATPYLKVDTIVDTIKPTIYFKGEVIQKGEVVVGTPDLVPEANK